MLYVCTGVASGAPPDGDPADDLIPHDLPPRPGDPEFLGVVWSDENVGDLDLIVPDGYPVEDLSFWLTVTIVSSHSDARDYSIGPVAAAPGRTTIPNVVTPDLLRPERLNPAGVRVEVERPSMDRVTAYLASEFRWFVREDLGLQRLDRSQAIAAMDPSGLADPENAIREPLPRGVERGLGRLVDPEDVEDGPGDEALYDVIPTGAGVRR